MKEKIKKLINAIKFNIVYKTTRYELDINGEKYTIVDEKYLFTKNAMILLHEGSPTSKVMVKFLGKKEAGFSKTNHEIKFRDQNDKYNINDFSKDYTI